MDGDSALRVSVELTSIHIDNPAGDAVMVCDALGRVISPRSTDVRQHIAVTPGIYLISNGTTIKAIVR